jgi:hypothetical protein
MALEIGYLHIISMLPKNMTKIYLMNGSRGYYIQGTNYTRWSTNCWECTWTVCNDRLETEMPVTLLVYPYVF